MGIIHFIGVCGLGSLDVGLELPEAACKLDQLLLLLISLGQLLLEVVHGLAHLVVALLLPLEVALLGHFDDLLRHPLQLLLGSLEQLILLLRLLVVALYELAEPRREDLLAAGVTVIGQLLLNSFSLQRGHKLRVIKKEKYQFSVCPIDTLQLHYYSESATKIQNDECCVIY